MEASGLTPTLSAKDPYAAESGPRPADGWIPVEEFCERHGERHNTISKRVADGAWERGVLFAVPDQKQGFVHEARALAWLDERRERK